MRLILLASIISIFTGNTVSAQAISEPPSGSSTSLTVLRLLPRTVAVGISPHRQSLPQSRRKEHDRAIADCMGMWDSGTHMTKQVWARTCKRVQTRLDNLKVDGLILETNKRAR